MQPHLVYKLVVFILVLIALATLPYFFDVEMLFDQEHFQTLVDQNGLSNAPRFIVIMLFLSFILLPVSVISITAGLLFGGFEGGLIALAVVVTGSFASFSFARYFGGDAINWVLRRHAKTLKGYTAFIERYDAYAVLLFKSVPLLPNMVVNLGFGLLKVRPFVFVLGTAIGAAPGAFILSYTGNYLFQTGEPQFYILLLLYGLFILSISALTYRLKNSNEQS